ncbi:periplasmic heavy metal sensor [bacterium]|nr:periplasmic heavy metal sensor [bacterium]
MKQSKWRGLVLFSLIIFLVNQGLAQPMGEHNDQVDHPVEMMDELQLSEDQEKQMQDLRFKHKKTMIGLRADLDIEELKLKELKIADEPDKKKIHTQIEKVGSARIKLDKSRADHHLEVRNVFNKDQQKLFRKSMHRKNGSRGNLKGDKRTNRERHRTRG